MSQLTPLEFSILTPIIKAFTIVCCAVYFGDDFGVQSAIGVTISLWGGYVFTIAKGQAEKAAAGSPSTDSSASSSNSSTDDDASKKSNSAPIQRRLRSSDKA
jgi:hypothetical protein